MANGKLYLRPNRDVLLEHTISPYTLAKGCDAINEVVCDAASTYISYSDKDGSCTSRFAIAMEKSYKILKIFSGAIVICPNYHQTSNTGYSYYGKDIIKVFINNSSYNEHEDDCNYPEGEEIADYTEQRLNLSSDEITALEAFVIANGFLPTLELEINTHVEFGNNSDKGGQSGQTTHKISQVFVELDCEYQSNNGIYKKNNSIYKSAITAYKKADGTWSAISEDEAKTIISSNTIQRE